ncbi:MAG: efflux RND transporter periplasmic adaptor subunit [Candidatus Schekmanbacteria bacterium]|nr:efflux RND transporter periplasmic adaptor subunit [Candidatus Schekmanbacteria bacterium]
MTKTIALLASLLLIGGCGPAAREDANQDHEKHADDHRGAGDAQADDHDAGENDHTDAGGAVAPGAGEGPRHEGEADEQGHGEGAAAVVEVAPDMMRDLRFVTATVAERPIADGVTVLGEVRVDEDAYAEVGTPIAARVVRLLAGPGDVVRAGQVLVELDAVELGRARAEYHAARSRAELALRALARKQALAAERIAAQRELEEAQAEAETTAAELRAAGATLRALGAGEPAADAEPDARLVLRAPIAGTIVERRAVRGQLADPAAPLYRIADFSRLWLVAEAFERDALRVVAGAEARVTFAALPGRTFSGRVTLVGQEVNVASRTIPIRIVIQNDERLLRPGMSASAWLPLRAAAGGGTARAVPAAALQRLADDWFAFVPREPGRFEQRRVRRGRDLGGGNVEVLSGLAAGETVVVEGAFLLKAQAEKAAGGGAGHHH